MNDGVRILLERMKTNPEEFIGEDSFAYSKWGSLIGAYKEFLDPEDQKVLTNGLNALLQQAFTEKVLQELIDPVEENSIAKLSAEIKKARLPNFNRKNTPSIPNISLGQTPIAGVTQTL